MYTVMLDDGTTFTNLTVNGSYFVSQQEVTRGMFSKWRGSYRVIVDGEEDVYGLAGEHSGCELGDLRSGAGGYYFALSKVDVVMLERERARADIEYIAMMTGIQL